VTTSTSNVSTKVTWAVGLFFTAGRFFGAGFLGLAAFFLGAAFFLLLRALFFLGVSGCYHHKSLRAIRHATRNRKAAQLCRWLGHAQRRILRNAF
jgi:hypothetical protein